MGAIERDGNRKKCVTGESEIKANELHVSKEA